MGSLLLLSTAINDSQNFNRGSRYRLKIRPSFVGVARMPDLNWTSGANLHEINRHDQNIRYLLMLDKPKIDDITYHAGREK